MSQTCNPDCITALSSFEAINACNPEASLRSAEIKKLVVGRCDLAFTDITDQAEWQTKIANGDIVVMLTGNGSLAEKTYGQTIRIGCSDYETSARKAFEFMTYLADNTGYTEWSVYNNLIANRANLSVMFLSCDNILYINPDYTAGGNPLINTTKIDFDQVLSGEADGKAQWITKGEISEYRILKPALLPNSVIAVI